MSTDKIIEKLAKLKAHAESAEAIGNQEEAAAFAAKFQELLMKHELTMSEIEFKRVASDDPMGREFATGGGAGQRRLWQEQLASVIASAFFCRILVYKGSDLIAFVGRETHRQAAEYVYSRLRRELEETSKREYKSLRSKLRRNGEDLENSHGFKTSFRRAYVRTIQQRLKAQRQSEKEQIEGTAGGGTALIRLDTALVKVDEYMKEQLRTKSAKGLRGQSGSNELGRQRGEHHGRKANLGADGLGSGNASATKHIN